MAATWGRWVFIAGLLLAVGVLVFGLPGGGGASPAQWTHLANPNECARCHAAIVAEWRAGWHSQARTDPELDQMLINKNMTPTECNLCHAPRPVFEFIEDGRARTPANRVDSAAWPIAQGVDCLSCHWTPEGGMASADPRFQGAGRPAASDAPCRPIYRPDLATATHCSACHNQHGTADQWRATPHGTDGDPQFTSCQGCHMPVVAGPATTGRPDTHHRGHHIVGGHTPALVRSAAALGARREGDTIVVEVDVRATGHNFPTDYRTRFALLLVEALDGDGQILAELHRQKFRQPFRNEPGGSDPAGNTQLRWQAEPHVWRVDAARHPRVRVRLLYSLRPYTDRERPHDVTEDRIVGDRMFVVAERIVE